MTGRLSGRVALVSGASSGIGRAIAIGLAHKGAAVCALGRDPVRLSETLGALENGPAHRAHETDLTIDREIDELPDYIAREFGRLDILVHSAAIVYSASMQESQIERLDLQYRVNLRAPYLVTQKLLSLLRKSRGEIVFINSSVGLSAKTADIGQYAATKHGLRAIADSLREEVNADAVRVLTVYPGRTATPTQQMLHELDGVPYNPDLLLQPEDVAELVVSAILLPRTAEVTEISIRPMNKTR